MLEIEDLSKEFGNREVVRSLSFRVGQGEIFGFLGANGAGKTTTLRMILDIIRPTSGRICVLGREPGRHVSREIGFLPEERGLYKHMSAIDIVTYFGQLKGMTASASRQAGKELLGRFDLSSNLQTKIEKLSKGMAQKVQLATALVNRPRLLILDEPFSGLDPVNQQLLEAEIVEAARNGAAVVFSTHVMQHAERLCDRLLLLANGRKKFEGSLADARRQLPTHLSVVARDSFGSLPGVAHATATGAAIDGWQAWTIELEPGISAADMLEKCTSQSVPLRRFEETVGTLHDVFMHVVGKDGIPA